MEEYRDVETEKRIISDAELIRCGAKMIGFVNDSSIDPKLGSDPRLRVTELQTLKAELTGDASCRVADILWPLADWPDSNEFIASDETLDRSIDSAWAEIHPDVKRDGTVGYLRRSNITSIRDLLVLGKDRVGGIRGIGDKKIEYLQALLRHNTPDREWLDSPSPKDITEICEDLIQVSALVLVSPDLILRHKMSIKDVLMTTEDERAEMVWGTQMGPDALGEKRSNQLYRDAETFALEFYRVKDIYRVRLIEDADLS